MLQGSSQDIAVIGSPSTNTEITADLLLEATEERVVGALVSFDAAQNGIPIKSVGQIVGIELKNRWHEDSVFRNLIKRTGDIPPITNRQDTRTASLVVGATFKRDGEEYEPDVLGMVPPTGTRIVRVDQTLLDSLLRLYQAEVFYLGRAYANDVFYPMWFKHFASGPQGAGEAYHLGVFGKTGSGKSGLAKMLLLAYSRHQEMGILIIDPQGEFSLELSGTMVGQQRLPVKDTLDKMGRTVEVYRISDLQLDEWDLFEELLVSLRFTEQLGIPQASADNSRLAAEIIRGNLEGSHRLRDLSSEDVFRNVLNNITNEQTSLQIYRTPNRATQLRQRVQQILGDDFTDVYQNFWLPLTNLFASGSGRRSLFGIVSGLVGAESNGTYGRPIIAVDLSERGNSRVWSESLQRRLIKRLLDNLVAYASRDLGADHSANTLVLLDEAARLAPAARPERGSEEDQLRTTLRTAVRETRKFGIGWFFVSQTLGGIDNEILQQLRIHFFGFGLALGDEFRKLREFAGGDDRAMELYQSFRDPHSAPRSDLREFPFMAVGPVSPLSFSGKPVFFSAFQDSVEYIRENHLQTQSRLGGF